MFYIYATNSGTVKKQFLFFLFLAASAIAQPKLELTPQGFLPIEITRPNKTNEKLVELSQSWAAQYNKEGYDVYDATENSLSIDGVRENAFFYRNVGEAFYHKITYTLKITFGEKTCTMAFSVKEIYARKILLETTIADYFTPDGKLKEDMDEVKPSLESTANKIIKSYVNFISAN